MQQGVVEVEHQNKALFGLEPGYRFLLLSLMFLLQALRICYRKKSDGDTLGMVMGKGSKTDQRNASIHNMLN